MSPSKFIILFIMCLSVSLNIVMAKEKKATSSPAGCTESFGLEFKNLQNKIYELQSDKEGKKLDEAINKQVDIAVLKMLYAYSEFKLKKGNIDQTNEPGKTLNKFFADLEQKKIPTENKVARAKGVDVINSYIEQLAAFSQTEADPAFKINPGDLYLLRNYGVHAGDSVCTRDARLGQKQSKQAKGELDLFKNYLTLLRTHFSGSANPNESLKRDLDEAIKTHDEASRNVLKEAQAQMQAWLNKPENKICLDWLQSSNNQTKQLAQKFGVKSENWCNFYKFIKSIHPETPPVADQALRDVSSILHFMNANRFMVKDQHGKITEGKKAKRNLQLFEFDLHKTVWTPSKDLLCKASPADLAPMVKVTGDIVVDADKNCFCKGKNEFDSTQKNCKPIEKCPITENKADGEKCECKEGFEQASAIKCTRKSDDTTLMCKIDATSTTPSIEVQGDIIKKDDETCGCKTETNEFKNNTCLPKASTSSSKDECEKLKGHEWNEKDKTCDKLSSQDEFTTSKADDEDREEVAPKPPVVIESDFVMPKIPQPILYPPESLDWVMGN